MVKSIFLRPWDLLCVIWFVVHIPMTVLLDSQSGEWRAYQSVATALAALCGCHNSHHYSSSTRSEATVELNLVFTLALMCMRCCSAASPHAGDAAAAAEGFAAVAHQDKQ